MKRRTLFQANIIILIVILFSQQTLAEIPSSLLNKVQPAVVTVITFDAHGKELGYGSGFFINKQGHLITNFHVLLGAYKAKIKDHRGKFYDIDKVLAEDRIGDLVMVSTSVPGDSIQDMKVSRIIPNVGERVIVIGSPGMGAIVLEQTVSEGVISAFRDIQLLGGKRIQITAPISPGSSGGPVVNLKGEVIGIVVATASNAQNINFAIPGGNVLTLKPVRFQSLSDWTTNITKEWLKTSEGKYWSAAQFFWQGDYQKAISLNEEIIRENPKFTQSQFAIGLIYYLTGQGDKAVKALEQGLQLEPNFAVAHIVLGTAYDKLGRHKEATEAYKRGIQRGANGPNEYFLLGGAYSALRQFQEAAAAYEQGVRLKPNSPDEILQLGRAYALLNQPEKAMEAWKRAIWLNPGLVDAHYWLAYYYNVLGNKNAALTEFKEVERLDPQKAKELESIMSPSAPRQLPF